MDLVVALEAKRVETRICPIALQAGGDLGLQCVYVEDIAELVYCLSGCHMHTVMLPWHAAALTRINAFDHVFTRTSLTHNS